MSEASNSDGFFDHFGTTRKPRSQKITECVAVPNSDEASNADGFFDNFVITERVAVPNSDEASNADGFYDNFVATRKPSGLSQKHTTCVAVPNSDVVAEIVGRKGYKIRALQARTNTYIKSPARGDYPIFTITGRSKDVIAAKRELLADADHIMKDQTAQNYTAMHITEHVSVPSFSHVEKIVGSQSSKYKSWRNIISRSAHVKIPARGEDLIFVITGRPEDVAETKRGLVAAANHVMENHEAQKNDVQNQSTKFRQSPENDLITIHVRVPHGTVGLVVGRKGETIKRIQKQTSTFIFTPSRNKEPCFEVTGKPEDVERAKREIQSYIAIRHNVSFTDLESDFEKVAPLIERFRKSRMMPLPQGPFLHIT